ncbi:MAG: formylglycine-generating enzyme family protein [Calditrichaeota bacterium]|nr:MAG: formylglycine-generating enzyme family protein [Calditrichota bacterium]
MFKTIKLIWFFAFSIGAFSQPASQFVIPTGMQRIPAGEFEMGIPHDSLAALVLLGKKVPHMNILHAEGWYGDERPNHLVQVSSFYLDKYEVTNAQFREFIAESGFVTEGDWEKYATAGRENHPVVNVSWNDARTYAKWAGKRLPTEAEWEYAAKGGKNVKWFPWGEVPDESRAQWRHEGESFWDGLMQLAFGREINTKPVGSFEPNGYGLYDMCGNVREWCADDYKPYPGLKDSDWKHTKRRPFADSTALKDIVIARGGNWNSSNPVFIRLTKRSHFDKLYTEYTQGFRCAKSIQ